MAFINVNNIAFQNANIDQTFIFILKTLSSWNIQSSHFLCLGPSCGFWNEQVKLWIANKFTRYYDSSAIFPLWYWRIKIFGVLTKRYPKLHVSSNTFTGSMCGSAGMRTRGWCKGVSFVFKRHQFFHLNLNLKYMIQQKQSNSHCVWSLLDC